MNWIRAVSSHLKQFLYCSTPIKLSNILLIKIQKWLGRDHLFGYPYRFNIDPCNICNLKCPLCPTGLGVGKRPLGRMTFEDFKKIIDQIKPYAYYLELYNWGEPLLHPRIFDFIRYAADRRLITSLSSNLNYFNASLANRMVQSGLTKIMVSVDGATEESYQRYRRNGKLEKVVNNLQLLIEAKRRNRNPNPFITVRMLINRYNEKEIKALNKKMVDLGVDSFSTGPIFINTRDIAQVNEWLPRDKSQSCYDHSLPRLTNLWNCFDLWESMVINWDGGIAPCCWVEDPRFDFGNIRDIPLKEIWNGKAYTTARRVLQNRGKHPEDPEIICSICRGRPSYLEI